MRVSQITGALLRVYAGVDVVYDDTMPFRRSAANIADRGPKAVADENIVAIRLILIDALSDLLNGENLLTIEREIDDGASLRAAKEIFQLLHFAQTHGQKGFDGLPLHRLGGFPALRTGIRGARRAMEVLRGQFAKSISGFGWQQQESVIEKFYFLDDDLPCIAVGLEPIANAMLGLHVVERQYGPFAVKLLKLTHLCRWMVRY